MKLKEKITGMIAAVMLLSISAASVSVSAAEYKNPRAALTFEPKRTAYGICYGVGWY